MKKRVLTLICAVVVGVSSLVVSASASLTATIGSIMNGIMAAKEAIDTAIEYYESSVEIYDGLSGFWNGQRQNYEIERLNRLTIWESFITKGQISEANLREWYNTVLEVSGNVAYYTPPVSDEQMAIVNAYSLVQENVQYGITLDDICAHCYVSGVPTDNPDTGFDDDGNVQVSGKTFSEIVSQLQEQYGPGNSEGRLSWLEGDAFHPYNNYSLGFFTVLQLGNYIDSSNGKSVGIYLQPYFYDGTEFFYSDKVWHLYADTKDGDDTVYYYIDIYNTDYQLLESNRLKNHDIVKHKYLILCPIGNASGSKSGMGRSYVDEASWKNCPNVSSSLYYSASTFSLSTDSFRFYDRHYQENIFEKSVFEFSGGYPTSTDVFDCGFYWSNDPLEMGFFKDIDAERIPENYIITFGGDNIYNYTITNPDTGGSSTINEYITNNYTINNYYGDGETGESGSSGGTSGDITVGGNIGVGGKVDVNLNVNVNTGSGGSGGTAEVVDPYDYEKVNLDEALEQIPEMGDGFTGFLSDVFDFLPPPVLGLIIGGIGLAILCRLAGR